MNTQNHHTHLMDGTWDGLSDARIAELHPSCVACKAGVPNAGNVRLPVSTNTL